MEQPTVLDRVRSQERVLIRKPDLFLLMQTTIQYFVDNDMPEEILQQLLGGLFKRNMYPTDLISEFNEFCMALDSAEGKEEIEMLANLAMKTAEDGPAKEYFEELEKEKEQRKKDEHEKEDDNPIS